jgi:hypothetical protein
MLIGKFRLEDICREKGLQMCEAVYGKNHVESCHGGRFYKIRYLKSYDCETGQMLAYPDGLPGLHALKPEERIKRVHFVGHSMGAITVRYLQYLLKVGYFDHISGQERHDRSTLIASITCLAGANNGSLVVNHCGMKYDRNKEQWVLQNDGKMLWAFKMTIFFQNLFKS